MEDRDSTAAYPIPRSDDSGRTHESQTELPPEGRGAPGMRSTDCKALGHA